MKDFQAIMQMLVHGSDEINRMKREIKTVTDVIVGLMREEDFSYPGRERNNLWYYGRGRSRGSVWYDSTTDGQWTISASGSVRFFVHNLRAFNELPDSKMLYCSGNGLKLEDVEVVYAALPAFVQAVTEAVPAIWNRIQPYERAAKHADSLTFDT